MLKTFVLPIPYLLVVLGFIWLAGLWHITLSGAALFSGALGWLAAYFLRIPVSILLTKSSITLEHIDFLAVASSGFLEESIRLFIILIIGRDLNSCYSIGLGWGGAEIAYTVVASYAINQIMQRDDEESVKQQIALKEAGMIHPWGDFLGVIERIFATAFHVGSTLLIGKWLWSTGINTILHSCLNIFVDKIASSKPITAQITIAVFGGLFFITGIQLSLFL